MEDQRITIPCEICKVNPAKVIKGGIYDNVRELWFVCKECEKLIDDTRSSKKEMG
jgi:protein-arginine kinase activator protein McsA